MIQPSNVLLWSKTGFARLFACPAMIVTQEKSIWLTRPDTKCGSKTAITARHGRGEDRKQHKKRHFRPEKLPHFADLRWCGQESRIDRQSPAPADNRQSRRNRQQPDDREGSDLRPEEQVDGIIGPTLGGDNRAGESDHDDRTR